MKIYQLKQENTQEIIEKVTKYMRAGAVVVIPTETCYGFAIDIKNPDAVQRLIKMKQRPVEIKFPVVVCGPECAQKYAQLDKKNLNWVSKNIPNSFTVIFPAINDLPIKYNDIALRFSTSDFVNKLSIEMDGFGLTSANLHGFPETYSLIELENQFAGKVFQPDIFIDSGEILRVPPTTIIDFRDKKPKIVRQGIFEFK